MVRSSAHWRTRHASPSTSSGCPCVTPRSRSVPRLPSSCRSLRQRSLSSRLPLSQLLLPSQRALPSPSPASPRRRLARGSGVPSRANVSPRPRPLRRVRHSPQTRCTQRFQLSLRAVTGYTQPRDAPQSPSHRLRPLYYSQAIGRRWRMPALRWPRQSAAHRRLSQVARPPRSARPRYTLPSRPRTVSGHHPSLCAGSSPTRTRPSSRRRS